MVDKGTDEAIETFGGHGCMVEYEVERIEFI